MLSLLKFILVAYLIYISLKFIFVRVVPMLLVRKLQKLQEEAINKQKYAQEAYRQRASQGQGYGQGQTQSQAQTQTHSNQNGKMTITIDPKKHNSDIQYDDGEYIDYEEVK